MDKTSHRIQQRYWWPGIERSVRAYVASCISCQTNKHQTGRAIGKMFPVPPPSQAFDTVSADHLGPFQRTKLGNKYVLVFIDHLTKWLTAVPVPDTTTEQTLRAIEVNVIAQHGSIRRLLTDRGSAFTSSQFAEKMDAFGVQHILATAERPQTNGSAERVIQTLTAVLRSRINVNQDDWDLCLPLATLSINTAKQKMTGHTPFELVYGRAAILPHESSFPWPPESPVDAEQFLKQVGEWRKGARRLIQQLQAKSKERYDRSRNEGPVYQRGDLVLVRRTVRKLGRTQKFLPRFIGPFQIVERLFPTTYLVEDVPTRRKRRVWRRFRAHVAQLKPFRVRIETDWLPEDANSSLLKETETFGAVETSCPDDSSPHQKMPKRRLQGSVKTRQGRAILERRVILTRSGRKSRSPLRYTA